MDDRFDWESLPIVFCIVLIVVLLTAFYSLVLHPTEEPLPELNHYPIPEEIVVAEEPEVEEAPVQEEKEPILSDEEIISRIVMAEAEGEPFLVKLAVASTVLNRCDMWGMTVESVATAKNQFAYPTSKKPNKDCELATALAMEHRNIFDSRMIWFRAGHYHKDLGEPYFTCENTYFSIYTEVTE